MRRYDLHCHSTWSDGVLPPAEVVARAHGNGLDVLALTDHDEIGGNAEAREAAAALGIEFVAGVEVSVSYQDETLHVVGLRIDTEDTQFREALAGIRRGRDARARRISESLAEAGIPGTYERARELAGNDELISRAHFARALVEKGAARDTQSCFKHYLVRGKPGFVPHAWPELGEAIGWIRAAGGDAVLAHPGRYRFGKRDMRALIAGFRELGGAAIEVVTSAHTREQIGEFAALTRAAGLKASAGSDFHAPDESFVDVGCVMPLPEGLEPVWSAW